MLTQCEVLAQCFERKPRQISLVYAVFQAETGLRSQLKSAHFPGHNSSVNCGIKNVTYLRVSRIVFPLIFLFTQLAFSAGELCEKALMEFPGPTNAKAIQKICTETLVLDSCASVNKVPIFHWDKKSKSEKAQKILVFSLIHGDEVPAGAVVRFWMERLASIDPKNTWRIVPILNPDGFKEKTRTNINKIDLNRNFPTEKWDQEALAYWKKQASSQKRRFPGNAAASEPEVQCAMAHLKDFNPDFVVSIHTPLKVLDFDGPKIKPPISQILPWKSLGNFPGSLGRFMWVERKTPVLTVEWETDLPHSMKTFEHLQDLVGDLAAFELKAAAKNSGKNKTVNAVTTKN